MLTGICCFWYLNNNQLVLTDKGPVAIILALFKAYKNS